MSLPSPLARLVPVGFCVGALLSTAWAAAPDDGLARRAHVKVFTTTRRERHFDIMPGEWFMCSSRRGLWMPYVFEGQGELRFQKHGACIFALENGKEGLLLGVRLGTRTGRPELRSAVKRGAGPLTIWCVEERGIEDIPPLPPGRYYALSAGTVDNLKLVSRLRPLKALRITCNKGVTDLSPLAELTGLESLLLRCDDVTDLGPVAKLTKLKVLHLYCGEGLTDISPLARLKGLRLLQIHCGTGFQPVRPSQAGSLCHTQLTDLSPLAELPGLGVLVIRSLSIQDISPLARLSKLTWLDLHGCIRVGDIGAVRHAPRLTHLDLGQCREIADLSPLADLTSLEYLDLHGAMKVTDISPLARLTRLRHLDLLGCHQITDLWPLRRVLQTKPLRAWVEGPLRSQLICVQEASPSKVTVLINGQFVTSLHVPLECADGLCAWANIVGRTVTPPAAYACGVNRLSFPIRGCQQGSVLDFRWDGPSVALSMDRGPRRLAGILATTAEGRAALSRALVQSGGPLVVWADASSVGSLLPLPAGSDVTLVVIGLGVPLKSLARTTNLTGLHVQSCGTTVSDLRPIAQLTSLKTLELPAGPRVASLRRLAKMTRLTSLTMRLSTDVDDLSPLASLTRLRTLRLTCSTPPDLAPLAALPNLKSLSLAGEINGSRLRGLDKLTNLETLSLEWHGNPADFALLARLANLRALHLTDCRNIAHLTPLASLGNLEVLTLRDCNRVADISPVASLAKLRSLKLELCESVNDINTLLALERRGVQLTLDSRLRRQMAHAHERPPAPLPGQGHRSP